MEAKQKHLSQVVDWTHQHVYALCIILHKTTINMEKQQIVVSVKCQR